MKTLQLLSAFIIGSMFLTSCVAEIIIEDDIFIEEPTISLDRLLRNYEIWYIDIERTQGNGEIPFLQKAFTVSFRNGVFYANNNLVGIGTNGDGFGLDVGGFAAFGSTIDIDHDIDGDYRLEVTQNNNNEIELYDRVSNTSYYLIGYQRNTFDYDKVFYDNIHYFLHEYTTWEKVYTSDFGVLNEFDNENYLQFLYYGSGDNFKSSQDHNVSNIDAIFYDYTGYYDVEDITDNFYMKNLTLDYDYLGNEYFQLTVINDARIALHHPISGTMYEFIGRRPLQFKNANDEKLPQNDKKRIKKAEFIKLTK